MRAERRALIGVVATALELGRFVDLDLGVDVGTSFSGVGKSVFSAAALGVAILARVLERRVVVAGEDMVAEVRCAVSLGFYQRKS